MPLFPFHQSIKTLGFPAEMEPAGLEPIFDIEHHGILDQDKCQHSG
jgi:hypothetical protein